MFGGFFVVFFLVYAPLPTLIAVWVWFVCFGLGRLVLGRVAESTLEKLVLWPAAGLGMASAAMFLLGLAGLYYWWAVAALLAAGSAAFWRNAGRLRDLWQRAGRAYAGAAAGPLARWTSLFRASWRRRRTRK